MKHGRSRPKRGPTIETHQQVELGIAVKIGLAHDAMAARRLGQIARRWHAEGVDAGVALQRRRIAQAFRRLELAVGRQQLSDQRLDFVHQRRVVESQTVPLDESEFGVVPAAAFGVAKHLQIW